jgi:hypothetical protein
LTAHSNPHKGANRFREQFPSTRRERLRRAESPRHPRVSAWLLTEDTAQALHLAGYGMAIPPQSQIRAAQAELLQVRRRDFHRRSWFPRGHGCKGQIVHGGLHPRHGPLQPDVFQPGRCGGRECGGDSRRSSGARQRNRACGGDACFGVHGWWAGGLYADAPHSSRARDSTSGCERACSAAAACRCEAKAGPSLKAGRGSRGSANVRDSGRA